MVGASQTRTDAEDDRFAKLKQMRCIACTICVETSRFMPTVRTVPEIHHLLSGNKRIGHMATLPLCVHHHRGEPSNGLSKTTMAAIHGPSLALSSRLFHQHFGTDEELLARVNSLLENMA